MPEQQDHAQAQPGGHSDVSWQGTTAPQDELVWQKQHPSTAMMHQQLVSHCRWPEQTPQPPTSIHAASPWCGANADTDDAVSIEPAPNAAAPSPARFNRRRLETLSSVTAIRETSVSLGMPY